MDGEGVILGLVNLYETHRNKNGSDNERRAFAGNVLRHEMVHQLYGFASWGLGYSDHENSGIMAGPPKGSYEYSNLITPVSGPFSGNTVDAMRGYYEIP